MDHCMCCQMNTAGQHEDNCPMNPNNKDARIRASYGWICPKCGRSNAMWLATCPCGPDIKIVTVTTSDEIVALRGLLEQADGIICDYVQKGNYDDNTEPFYTLRNSIGALLKKEPE